MADLAVAQIRCGLRQLDGQADGATSRELPMSDADQAAMQVALGEARQAIVAQSSASQIQSDASSGAAGPQQAGGASSTGSSQAGSSGQRQGAASSSSSSSTVRLVQGQSTGILALQASSSGLVGGPTGPGMDGGRSAALQARQEAAMDPGRSRAFVTPADKERIRSRKSLSLAVCSLEVLARAMRGLLGASSLNGPAAANPDPLAGPLPGAQGGGDEREMDRIIGAAQQEGAPLVPEATPAHLSAVTRLVLALALLMRVGAGHGPQATVTTLNAAMARHASGGERERDGTGSPASGSGSGAGRWGAPRCGLRPDAVASAGAAVAGLAASV